VPVLAVICLIGVALAGSASFAAAYGYGGWPVVVVALAALAMTGMMVTAFFPFYDITWDEDGIEGPTLLLTPALWAQAPKDILGRDRGGPSRKGPSLVS